MSSDRAIDDVLREMGFRGRAAAIARDVLEESGLTRPGKQRIAEAKLSRAAHVLRERLVVACARAECQAAGRTGRQVLTAERPEDCWICAGKPNRAEIDKAVTALGLRGWWRVVVVGGSPATHEELRRLVGSRLELRLVSGTDRRTAAEARGDLAWADVVVVWGSTELDHKVSKLYRADRDRRVVTCPRRGLAALAATLAEAAERP